MADTISISDRMSSSAISSVSSLNAAIPNIYTPNPKTTTISTIAVQCLNTRIVVALLQSRDVLTLRVLESSPSFHTVGHDVTESQTMLQEHMNVLGKLQNIESPVEELLRRVDSSLVSNPNPEVYIAMAECLGQAWKDLNNMLERRKELLEFGLQFHINRDECITRFANPEVDSVGRKETFKMYADLTDLGKKIIEEMHTIEDSAESVIQVEKWLEELWTKLTEWKEQLQIKRKSTFEENMYDGFVQELNNIIKTSETEPENSRRRLLLLISRLEEIEAPDKSKINSLITQCYEHLDKLNHRLQRTLSTSQFLLDNNQLHSTSFKHDHELRLQELEDEEQQQQQAVGTAAEGASSLPKIPMNKELKNILKIRLKIHNEYENILANVLEFPNDEEISKQLSKDLPCSDGLEIDGALLTIKERREQLENELYYQFKPQIDGIEQCLYDIGEIVTLKSLLEKTCQIELNLKQSPPFNGKSELESTCNSLVHALENKILALQSIYTFLFENRELTLPDFQRTHEEQLLKVVYELHHHELEGRFHLRLGLRHLYDEMLTVPLEYDEEQVEHLLTEDPSLDTRKALENYLHARRIDELIATLDFPLPENLTTAKNDLEDFKSFETIIGSLENPSEELIEKSKIKKENILKCIELYEILERTDRYEYIEKIEQLELEIFGSSTYAEALQEELKRNQENLVKTPPIMYIEEVEEQPPPIPPPPPSELLYKQQEHLFIEDDQRDKSSSSPSSATVILQVPSRPKSTSIETQTEQYYAEPYGSPPIQSPPPLLNPFQAEAFVQQTEHLIEEILERRELRSAMNKTPLHEMETQTFDEQPIELSHEETQTAHLPPLSQQTQTDELPDYDFIPYSPPQVFSPPPTPGIEIQTQTSPFPCSRPAETQTFTYQVLANRQTQTPAEFIRELHTPGYAVETQTTPIPITPEEEKLPLLPVPILPVVERCEAEAQTMESPRFLISMETQTMIDGYAEGEQAPSTHTVIHTEKRHHTYVHEKISEFNKMGEVDDGIRKQGQPETGSFLREMDTQTDTMPIFEPYPPIYVIPQSPEIAKFYKDMDSQTEPQLELPTLLASPKVEHERYDEEKQTITTTSIFKSEMVEYPFMSDATKESMPPNLQSSTIFADLKPQVVELKYEMPSQAQELCLASEEAAYEEALPLKLDAQSPSKEKPRSSFKNLEETVLIPAPPPPSPPPKPQVTKAVFHPTERLQKPAEIEIPISIETTQEFKPPIKIESKPKEQLPSSEFIQQPKASTTFIEFPNTEILAGIKSQEATRQTLGPIITSTPSDYETKTSIFEQSYVLEETSSSMTAPEGTMMDKGSGTPLSKVSDRIKAWEFYQAEPPNLETTQHEKKQEPPRPRPSSISEYRLLFQSPPPSSSTETKTTDVTSEKFPGPPAGAVHEYKKKFENYESTSKITTTTTADKPLIQHPGFGEKPTIQTPTTISTTMPSASYFETPTMTHHEAKSQSEEFTEQLPKSSVASYKRLFETYEQTQTITTSSSATADGDTGSMRIIKLRMPPNDQIPLVKDEKISKPTQIPKTSVTTSSSREYDKGIVSKFKHFFQSYDEQQQQQQPQPTTFKPTSISGVSSRYQPGQTSQHFDKTPTISSQIPYYRSQSDSATTSTSFPPAHDVLKRTSSSTSTTKSTTIQEFVKPSKFIPVTLGEWSEQSEYESDLESYKIPPIWVPPSRSDVVSPKFRPFSPPPPATINLQQASAPAPTAQPLIRTSAFTTFQEQHKQSGLPTIKPTIPPKPILSPSPTAMAGTTRASYVKSPIEKPLIPPKPFTTSSSSAATGPKIVPLPYESKQTSLTSTLTKSEETKFLLRPIKSPEPPSSTMDLDSDLKMTRKIISPVSSPEYFISITNPPISSITSQQQQSIPLINKSMSSRIQDTVRKLYETSTSTTTTKKYIEEDGGCTVSSPDMEPYYWRDTPTSPFYSINNEQSGTGGFYSASSREETPTPLGAATGTGGRKSVELLIPIQQEKDVGKLNTHAIIKPDPIKSGAAGAGEGQELKHNNQVENNNDDKVKK